MEGLRFWKSDTGEVTFIENEDWNEHRLLIGSARGDLWEFHEIFVNMAEATSCLNPTLEYTEKGIIVGPVGSDVGGEYFWATRERMADLLDREGLGQCPIKSPILAAYWKEFELVAFDQSITGLVHLKAVLESGDKSNIPVFWSKPPKHADGDHFVWIDEGAQSLVSYDADRVLLECDGAYVIESRDYWDTNAAKEDLF